MPYCVAAQVLATIWTVESENNTARLRRLLRRTACAIRESSKLLERSQKLLKQSEATLGVRTKLTVPAFDETTR